VIRGNPRRYQIFEFFGYSDFLDFQIFEFFGVW
jgi:hypothetical protein